MAVLARSCYIADDVEEQQQPLVTAAPSADLGASGGLLRLRAAPAFAAGLLLCGLAAVALVASGVTMRGAAPAAPDLGLGSLQQLNHYGAEAVQDECDMDRVTSTVCEEGQLFKGGEWILAQCEASCVKLWKDMEANCSGNSKRALKGKRMLADCDDSDEVVPAAFGTSKAALKEGKKANVMCDKIMNKIESACKLSKEEVNFQKQIGDLCAEGCMATPGMIRSRPCHAACSAKGCAARVSRILSPSDGDEEGQGILRRGDGCCLYGRGGHSDGHLQQVWLLAHVNELQPSCQLQVRDEAELFVQWLLPRDGLRDQ
mmetsp:Transcript_85838/g.277118  ORF Transcript_85838/g.277118 Transcript_85838/m.277118 type:complete len:316 (-) Transcript_85838:421-1368(-)